MSLKHIYFLTGKTFYKEDIVFIEVFDRIRIVMIKESQVLCEKESGHRHWKIQWGADFA